MNTADDHIDKKFRKLFEKGGLESPSEAFTANVMNQIAQLDPETEPASWKSMLRGWTSGIFIALLTVLGLSIMYYFGVGILPESFEPILAPVFGSIFKSFKGIFDSVSISSTTIGIILGFAVLVILERVLNRLRFTKNIYFYF